MQHDFQFKFRQGDWHRSSFQNRNFIRSTLEERRKRGMVQKEKTIFLVNHFLFAALYQCGRCLTPVFERSEMPVGSEIWGWDVTPKVGSVIFVDSWFDSVMSRRLEAGDSFSTFRVESHAGGPVQSIPLEVEVVGWTLQRAHSERVVRIKVSFPREGEPAEETRGWMIVPW